MAGAWAQSADDDAEPNVITQEASDREVHAITDPVLTAYDDGGLYGPDELTHDTTFLAEDPDSDPYAPTAREQSRWWSLGDPARGEDYIIRFGDGKAWTIDIAGDVAIQYGRGADEFGETLQNAEIELSPAIDIELNWLEDWLERTIERRVSLRFSASEENFEQTQGERGAPRSNVTPLLRARTERLTVDVGRTRLALDLENGASYLGALAAPATGLGQVLGPTVGLTEREEPRFRPVPIVTPVETRGVTKLVLQRSLTRDMEGTKRRTDRGFALSIGLEPFDKLPESDVAVPLEAAAWTSLNFNGASAIVSGIYSYGNSDGPDQDIRSWGVGGIIDKGRWRVGGSYADHGDSLRPEPGIDSSGITFGVERRFGGDQNPFTLAASTAITELDEDLYRAYSIGAEQVIRSGLAVRLDFTSFQDERFNDSDFGFAVVSEIRVQPRLGSWCTLVGWYRLGETHC